MFQGADNSPISQPVLGSEPSDGLLGSYPLPLRPFFPKLTQYPPLPIPLGWIAIAFCCEALPRYGSLRGFAPRFPHHASDATPFNFTFCRKCAGRVRYSRFRSSSDCDCALAAIRRHGSSWSARRAATFAAGPSAADELAAWNRAVLRVGHVKVTHR